MTKRRSKKREAKNEAKPKESKVEFLASLAGVLATGLFIITFMVQAFAIPSSSMENTLLVGDHVFVNRIQFAPATSWAKFAIRYDQIRRGDIVVFLSPQTPGLHIVKRVIGVPGGQNPPEERNRVPQWSKVGRTLCATRPRRDFLCVQGQFSGCSTSEFRFQHLGNVADQFAVLHQGRGHHRSAGLLLWNGRSPWC